MRADGEDAEAPESGIVDAVAGVIDAAPGATAGALSAKGVDAERKPMRIAAPKTAATMRTGQMVFCINKKCRPAF